MIVKSDALYVDRQKYVANMYMKSLPQEELDERKFV